MRKYLLFLTLAIWSVSVSGGTASPAVTRTYVKADDYISAALGKKPEKANVLWVTRDIRPGLKKILNRSKFPLRYRYWRQDNRTVWVLNEVGKILPITTGITIEDGKIRDLTVLTYRESHGSEIRFPAYSNQYKNVGLTDDLRLSKPINGISGATLSTNAMKKISRLALYLHKKLMEKDASVEKK